MDVEAEIRDLRRRVGELEGGFGFLTQQVRNVHLDLLGFQETTNERLGSVESELRGVKSEVTAVKAELGAVKAEVSLLREELPTIVGDVMREVLREPKR